MKRLTGFFFIIFTTASLWASGQPVEVSSPYAVINVNLPYMLSIKNTSTKDVEIAKLHIEGTYQKDFNITVDNCSDTVLRAGYSCDVGIKLISKTDEVKNALLDIPFYTDTGMQTINVFLTNYQNTSQYIQNNISPVMSKIVLNDDLKAGNSYDLNWSVTGYENSYYCVVAVFECDLAEKGECGNFYGSKDMIMSSGPLSYKTKTVLKNRYENMNANLFDYSYKLVLPDKTKNGQNWNVKGTDIVIRFYIVSSTDEKNGLATTSLIIPKDVGNRQYDDSGRKLLRTVCPVSGCIKQ